MAKIAGIATAVPAHALDQADVVERVRAQFSHSSVVTRLLPVFANTGIERRYSCVPIEWYYDEHRWPDRNAIYRESAVELLADATLRALVGSGRRIDEVDTIVVASTTGIATPSLDALLMERLPFKRTVRRLPIFGLGCVGGAVGLARASAMADAYPGSVVLFLVVELCALWFRRDEISKSNIVATALFGDGAAATILVTDGPGPRIVGSGEHTFPGTLDVMGWDVADDGLSAIFSRDIPHLVETELRGVLEAYLALSGLSRGDIDVFLSHPGGTKVLDALESAFGVASGSLVDSRTILRDYGNMSAVTLLFVLERALREGALVNDGWSRALLSAMGPGFTTAFVTLER
ncbi:MAG TPA: 3-oxoacyl-[acyl-carrier-protein] synthase III C-terminal domain-containing protein [Candidatus Baltobacteraceae bacterium]|nr:3-oxoacyl-[acyl-carrier-protein] synthase III C-terminal domain-containing protein [Candidatus Baltobacteraceae bacterium]